MKRRLGVVMDPIAGIHYPKDTTLALLWAAQDRGYSLLYMEQQDLFLDKGLSHALARPLEVFTNPQKWFQTGEPQTIALGELDVILMRKDPPFDMNFIYSTYLLEAAEERGALVVNRPASLRDCNEKLFATRFPQCCPPLLVSSNKEQIRDFAREQGDIVLKPLDGMGGSGVFQVMRGDPNFSAIVETLTEQGLRPIMAQRYLPEIAQGDKRILMVNGEPMPYCLARIPKPGEARGNLAAGGKGQVRPLTERDRWIAAQVGPVLRQRGLWFVGLDVIGDYLTEINVTSPTCLREMEAAQPSGIAEKLMSTIEELLQVRSAT